MKKLIASGFVLSTLLGITPQISTLTTANTKIHNENNLPTNFPKNSNLKGVNGGNEIEFRFGCCSDHTFYCSFKPEWWEEVENIKLKNLDIDEFANRFTNKVFNGVWMDYRIEDRNDIMKVAKCIYNNFSEISNKFRNSSRKERIRIVIDWNSANQIYSWFSLNYVNIRTDDSHYYSNLYLDNLQRDFPDLNNETINLGIVDYDGGSINIFNNFLSQTIKKKYSNLNVNDISFENRTEYNPNENYNYSIKMNVNADCQYSHGLLKPKVFYTTKYFLKRVLPNLIKENGQDLMQDWQNKFNNWKVRVDDDIKNNLPSFTDAQKRSWQHQQWTTLEDKLHDYLQNLAIIDLRMKVKHLYDTAKIIQNDLQKVKEKINDLEEIIKKLQVEKSKALAWASSITGLISSLSSWIPVVGTGISTITAIASSVTAVADTAS